MGDEQEKYYKRKNEEAAENDRYWRQREADDRAREKEEARERDRNDNAPTGD